MTPVQNLEEQVESLLRFCPPDTRDAYISAIRLLIEEVIVSILVSPIDETLRLRGQLEVLLVLMDKVAPGNDVLRETVQSIVTAEES
jgi:hypothetical protein